MQYGPSQCDGVGMSDVEVMERLWSYLRGFSRMKKEMRPAHRTDVLVQALLHYGMKKKMKMCKRILYLPVRWHVQCLVLIKKVIYLWQD